VRPKGRTAAKRADAAGASPFVALPMTLDLRDRDHAFLHPGKQALDQWLLDGVLVRLFTMGDHALFS
jgi:hypothetical protein